MISPLFFFLKPPGNCDRRPTLHPRARTAPGEPGTISTALWRATCSAHSPDHSQGRKDQKLRALCMPMLPSPVTPSAAAANRRPFWAALPAGESLSWDPGGQVAGPSPRQRRSLVQPSPTALQSLVACRVRFGAAVALWDQGRDSGDLPN